MSAKLVVKEALTRIGAALPPRVIYDINGALNYLDVGRWALDHGYSQIARFSRREQLFEVAARELSGARVLYLEFGVAGGASLRTWSRLLRDPASHLHGFDSFVGLPTDWILNRPAGWFSTGGEPPQVDDPRVRFFAGWFEDTLPTYQFPDYDRLVVNMDADLYSSTAAVLQFLRDRITPGTFLYFDEFNHRADERRAFDELLASTSMEFRLVGATRGLAQVMFERVG